MGKARAIQNTGGAVRAVEDARVLSNQAEAGRDEGGREAVWGGIWPTAKLTSSIGDNSARCVTSESKTERTTVPSGTVIPSPFENTCFIAFL